MRRLKQLVEWLVVGALLVRKERRRDGRRGAIEARSRLVLAGDGAKGTLLDGRGRSVGIHLPHGGAAP